MTSFKPEVLNPEIERFYKMFEEQLGQKLVRSVITGAGFFHPCGIHTIIDLRIRAAAEASLNAGYSGESTDGGAKAIVAEAVAFCRGIAFATEGGTALSEEWKKYMNDAREIRAQVDPEFELFQKLKKKFE